MDIKDFELPFVLPNVPFPEGIKELTRDPLKLAPPRVDKLQLNIKDLFEADPHDLPRLDFVLPNLPAGNLGSLISPGGTGKSMLALQMAILVACGEDIGGISPNQPKIGKVIFLPAEDPAESFAYRLNVMATFVSPEHREALYQNLTIHPLVGSGPDILDDNWLGYLYQLAFDRRLMILDTFRRFHNGDENDSSTMAIVLNRLERVALETNCAIIFLHHSSKSSAINATVDQQQAARGSSVLTDNCRWQGFLVKMSETEAGKRGVSADARHRYLRFGLSKINFGEPYQEIWLERQNGGVLRRANLPTPSTPGRKVRTYGRENRI
jgi:RecA-family ATPase